MKNTLRHILLVAVAGSLAFLYSCNKEETFEVPSIIFGGTVTSGSSVAAGTSFELEVTIVAPAGFNSLNILSSNPIERIARTDSRFTLSANNKQASITFTIPAPTTTGTYEIEFEAVDDKNQIGTATFEFSVTSPLARTYSAKLLQVPTANQDNKNFFASSNGNTYSRNDVTSTSASISPLIDFGYYYTTAAGLASPKWFETSAFSSQVDGWTTKNETKLRSTSLNASAFNEVTTWAGLDAAFAAGTAEAAVKFQLAVGNVLAFETAQGKKGLILITAIDPGFESNKSITIDVKVQETAN